MALNIGTISEFPTPPSSTDRTNFRARADAFLAHFPAYRIEHNAIIAQLNTIYSGFDQIEPTKEWDVDTTYNFPETAAGSDGHTYRCIGLGVLGINPVTDDGTYWIRISGGAEALETVNNLILNIPITYRVGPTGDYQTINAALEAIGSKIHAYREFGVLVTLELQTGFVMSEQVIVRGINLGWVTITSASGTTITRSALIHPVGTEDLYNTTSYPVFAAIRGAVLPRIGALFTMDTSGTSSQRDFLICSGGSKAIILNNCGVSDAARWGVFASGGAIVEAAGASLSACGIPGQGGAILATRCSVVNANNSRLDGSYTAAGASSGSTVNIESALCRNTVSFAVVSDGATVSAIGANALGSGSTGFYVRRGGSIRAASSSGTLSQTANTITANGIIFK